MDEKVAEELGRTSVTARTPITAASEVVCWLADICGIWNLDSLHDRSDPEPEDNDTKSNMFFKVFFGPLWDEENTSGDEQAKQIKEYEDMTDWQGEPLVPGFKEACVQLAILFTSCAYAIQAMKATRDSQEAWSYACEANRWLGLLQGYMSGRGLNNGTVFSRKGGVAKNAPTALLREWVVDEYENRSWPSAYKASFEIAPKAIEKAPTFGASLSQQRAQQTIYEWLRKHENNKTD
ncbi:hypothetical protein GN109_24110 [Collimonas pratensis]|uniref:hypothetical protein n=1 Tax=Collimonas pratensis TaxID=279113 RepID=UPI00143D6524|nr:hypothetical protein [Collimonas pratensis]NKI72512.1 hypothetical protein [Collimonas pratensis]